MHPNRRQLVLAVVLLASALLPLSALAGQVSDSVASVPVSRDTATKRDSAPLEPMSLPARRVKASLARIGSHVRIAYFPPLDSGSGPLTMRHVVGTLAALDSQSVTIDSMGKRTVRIPRSEIEKLEVRGRYTRREVPRAAILLAVLGGVTSTGYFASGGPQGKPVATTAVIAGSLGVVFGLLSIGDYWTSTSVPR